jgi:hypothetical protein
MNPGGNERLTAAVGLLVLAPVAVEVATILLGVHTFMSVHVFVGLALIPAVLLKLASTGWQFMRYYTRSRAYVEQGPPQLAMRLLAPLFVAATVVLFGSGVALGIVHGQALQVARNLHGPASVIWLVLLGLHVVVYLKRALSRTAEDLPATRKPLRGTRARAYALATVVAGGLLLGVVTVPVQHHWVNLRRDHGHRDGAAAINPPRGTSRSRVRTTRGRSSRRPAAPSRARRSGRLASSRRA